MCKSATKGPGWQVEGNSLHYERCRHWITLVISFNLGQEGLCYFQPRSLKCWDFSEKKRTKFLRFLRTTCLDPPWIQNFIAMFGGYFLSKIQPSWDPQRWLMCHGSCRIWLQDLRFSIPMLLLKLEQLELKHGGLEERFKPSRNVELSRDTVVFLVKNWFVFLKTHPKSIPKKCKVWWMRPGRSSCTWTPAGPSQGCKFSPVSSRQTLFPTH